MSALADRLDVVNRRIGLAVRWLALAMAVLQFGLVLARYGFGVSSILMDEGVLYLHATLFMLGAGYTFLADGHVRVDIFQAKAGPRGKAAIDLFGHLVLLVPALGLLLWYSWPSVWRSWAILEGSISVGGIPASFLLKTLIPLFCLLLLLQALARGLRDFARLMAR
ncbi:MAG: TRAP transporter small permease subunit [Pseudomonadota bacterium]